LPLPVSLLYTVQPCGRLTLPAPPLGGNWGSHPNWRSHPKGEPSGGGARCFPARTTTRCKEVEESKREGGRARRGVAVLELRVGDGEEVVRGDREEEVSPDPVLVEPRRGRALRAAETCPISTEGWTRRVHFVREGGGVRAAPGVNASSPRGV